MAVAATAKGPVLHGIGEPGGISVTRFFHQLVSRAVFRQSGRKQRCYLFLQVLFLHLRPLQQLLDFLQASPFLPPQFFLY